MIIYSFFFNEKMKYIKEFDIVFQMMNQRGYMHKEQDNETFWIYEKKKHTPLYLYKKVFSVIKSPVYDQIIETMRKQKIKHIFMVTKDKPTPNAKNKIQGINKKTDFQIEVFLISELQFNITKHYLVPHHEIATPNKFIVENDKNFPYISVKDPIVKFYNFKLGQIIKIQRNESITYRKVFSIV